MIGKVIFDILSNAEAITSVVPEARITPKRRLQEGQLPAITYEVIDCVPTDTKDGVSPLDTERISIHTWSKNYMQASTIAKNVRTAMDRYSNATIDKIIFDDRNEIFEDDAEVHHIIVDFKVRIKK